MHVRVCDALTSSSEGVHGVLVFEQNIPGRFVMEFTMLIRP